MGGRSGSRASVNRTRTTPCSPPTGPSCSPPAHHLRAWDCTPPLNHIPQCPVYTATCAALRIYPSPPEIPRESPVNASHLIQQPCQAFELPCSGRCLRCGGRRVRRLRLSDQRLTHQADDQPVALDRAHALLQLVQDLVLVLDVAALRLPIGERGGSGPWEAVGGAPISTYRYNQSSVHTCRGESAPPPESAHCAPSWIQWQAFV